jgi:hypothetical protein
MENSSYHIQAGRVLWRHHEVKGADPATFEVLGRFWARDAQHIYTQNSVNRQADRETFQALNYLYAKDKDHAFYLSGVIKEADAATFRVLDEGRHSRPGWLAPAEDDDSGWAFEGFACDAAQVFHYVMTIGKPRWTIVWCFTANVRWPGRMPRVSKPLANIGPGTPAGFISRTNRWRLTGRRLN